MQPIFPLFRYQGKVVADRSRLKGWLKARQVGGSTTATLDAVLDMIENGSEWNTMSRTGRQAKKLIERAARHVRACDEYARSTGAPPIFDPNDITTDRIRLLNGATMMAVPCDEDTTVGDTANWLLDEFARFPNSYDVFGAIKPSIRWGKRLLVLSSAKQKRGSKFYELWNRFENEGPASGWSFHKTTIVDAVADGCPLFDHEGRQIDFETFRRQEIADIGEELWEREYMCKFTDYAISFLTIAMLRACASPAASLVKTNEQLAREERDLFVGVDVGRHHDLTVAWVLSRTGDTYTTESVLTARDTPFAEQQRMLAGLLATRCVVRCAIDRQGLGMQLAESLAEAFPGIVEPTTITAGLKDEMSARVLRCIQGQRILLPDAEEVLDDFNSVEKTFTSAGSPRIIAPRSASGHADRFWACALAIHAAETYDPYEIVMSVA